MGLAGMAPASAHAELYKWTDSQGKTHYSDQPPSSDARSIGRSSAGPTAITRDAQKSLDQKEDAYQKRKKAADEARAKADAEAEQARIKRENCDKARQNLAVLRNKSRVYTSDAAGQRVYMDDAARAEARANSQQAINDLCS